MKIIKEDLDNLERVDDRQTVQGIMMKDAEEQSKKSEDNFKKVAGDPQDLKKKKPFISGEKQPKPKDVEIPKPELEESLFENAEESENSNRVHQYSVDIIESSNQSSKHTEDKIVRVLEDAGIRVAGCMASDTSWGMSEYGLSESKKIKESTKLHESGGVKDGILYSTYGEPLTFWDKIYAELDGNLSNDNDYTKLIELPVKVKNKYQEISVTNDGNIRVFSPSEEGLQHALDVAEHYGLDYESGASTGYSDPAKAFYCTVIIPEERQEEFVTYDARKSRPVKKDNIKVA